LKTRQIIIQNESVLNEFALVCKFDVSFVGTRPHTPLFLSAKPTTTHAPHSVTTLAALQGRILKKSPAMRPNALEQIHSK
jgi:hypothetical protein